MKIETYDDLKSEIARLQVKSKEQEQALLEKLHEVRASFSPQNIIMSSLSSLTGIPLNKAEFMRKGVLVALTYVVQKLLKKSELKLETIIANWFNEIGNKVKDFFRKNEEKNEAEDF